MFPEKYPNFRQHESQDCGPTCFRILLKYYRVNAPLTYIKNQFAVRADGVSLKQMKVAGEKLKFDTAVLTASIDDLRNLDRPVIVYFTRGHFVVLFKVNSNTAIISDPAHGVVNLSIQEFKAQFYDNSSTGVIVSASPLFKSAEDYFIDPVYLKETTSSLSSYFKELLIYKGQIFQVFVGLIVLTIFSLILPFLTQTIVDVGIENNDLNFIVLILIAQMILFLGQGSVEFIRAIVVSIISGNLGITIANKYLKKVLSLPMTYFERRNVGDFIQRISDNERIQSFISQAITRFTFSLITLVVFGFVLFLFDKSIFNIFIVGSTLYLLWLMIFLRLRKRIDQERFTLQGQAQGHLIQTFEGIHDIKLQTGEFNRREEWDDIQYQLFGTKIRSIKLDQLQDIGARFINQSKNALITFVSAKLLMNGDITYGSLLAIQFINGQLNMPITDILLLIRGYQDAKLSAERLNDVYNVDSEVRENHNYLKTIPVDKSITLKDVEFSYHPDDPPVLKGITTSFPHGKITAIVGESGSGKSTLMKIIMKHYHPTTGEVTVGSSNLTNIDFETWRRACGVVVQGGVLFSTTVAENIAMGSLEVDFDRVVVAAKQARIHDYIMSLPLQYNTKLGYYNKVSEGQKQRILIARALYKDPEYFFMDEATNSLDANVESDIVNSLKTRFKDKTVILIAHRLSTVIEADHIIYLKDGLIVEEGTHEELLTKGNHYRKLVFNQVTITA